MDQRVELLWVFVYVFVCELTRIINMVTKFWLSHFRFFLIMSTLFAVEKKNFEKFIFEHINISYQR